jgi:transposase
MDSLERIDAPATPDQDATVYIAFELSKKAWKLGIVVSATAKLSRYTVAGGDTAAVAARIAAATAKAAQGGRPGRVASLYPACMRQVTTAFGCIAGSPRRVSSITSSTRRASR